MTTRLSKTIFIGLGGTGAKSLLRAKSMFLENFGEIPPMIKFLAFDTDFQEKLVYKNQKGKLITFDTSEFHKIEVPSVGGYYDANPEIASFFPKELTQIKSSITEGAGQLRSCGRLAFIRDYARRKGDIENIISKVQNWTIAHNPKYDLVGDNLTVVIVFSLAGGTGAGTFIDFPMVLKEYLKDEDKIMGIGLLPDIFSLKGLVAHNANPNAFTSMLEYEFIADGNLEEMCSKSDIAIDIKTNYGSYSIDNKKLYDYFFMVNNMSKAGFTYSNVNEIADFLGKSLFIFAGSTGGEAGSTLDNVNGINAANPHDNKHCRYLGLGALEIAVDNEQLSDYYSLRYLDKVIDKINSNPQEADYFELVDSMIDTWQIREEDHDEDVINRILNPRPDIPFTNLSEFDKGAALQLKHKKEKWLEDRKNEINLKVHDIDGTLSKLLGEKLNLLTDFIADKIDSSEIGGVVKIKHFLNKLKGRINGFINELHDEVKEYKLKIDNQEPLYNEAFDSIVRDENQRFIFKSKSKEIELECEEYVSLVNREIHYIYEKERRESAIIFFNKYLDKINFYSTQILSFENQLQQVDEKIETKIAGIKSEKKLMPFKISLNTEALKLITLSNEEIDYPGFISNIKLSSIILGKYSKDQLFDKFKSYTDSLDKTKEIKSLTILDIIQDLDESYYEFLASKVRSISQIMRIEDKDIAVAQESAFVIGVHDPDHPTMLIPEEGLDDDEPGERSFGEVMRNALTINLNAEVANSNDPGRIIILRYESGLPAFAIHNFKRYKKDYLEHKESSGVTLFSNRYWQDKIESTGFSIFPSQTSKAIIAWTLGWIVSYIESDKDSGYPLIRKIHNGDYEVRSQQKGDATKEYWYPLSAYRPKSFDMFQNDINLVNEILNEITDKINNSKEQYLDLINELKNNKSTGPRKYTDEVSMHMLKSLHSEQHESTRKQITEEYNCLAKLFLTDLGI